ncbi:Predicted secreted protein [Novosphingobium panipatense]|uniref:Predicted secreted protein n=2 Tax=Novosphingobium panipatense TaxID=428991 RepID=A0ABY1QLB9_9SPHN|nr:Predicted secreted protein [Novosphingobium panipatense]
MAMNWTSIAAIYVLFWVMSAFIVLPIGLRTPDEVDGHVVGRGHADSAPVNFRPMLVAKRATVLAAVLFGLYYANYALGWFTVEDINFFDAPVKDLGY